MVRTLSLGYSPCPNDTFIFHALVHGLVSAEGLRFEPRLEDVETLNRLAAEAALDVTKVSYGAIPHLVRDYVLLRSGGALGRGCGPLVVAREGIDPAELAAKRIAIPGRNTTANLLLRLFAPGAPAGEERVYSDIMPAVARGEVDAGLIIHESRFTYPQHGLVKVVDLGEWWEGETGLPIPLGGILARRDLGADTIRAVDDAIRRSVEHAFADPAASRSYVRAHAQEMDEAVCRQHIDLYVNRFSADVGDEGERAIEALFARARQAGIIDADVPSPFLAGGEERVSGNYFAHATAAERYARARPYFHPVVIDRIAPHTGRVERALDVGCGTGMSSVALAGLAGAVVGADASVSMLACAEPHPRVRYAAAAAEALPFPPGTFGLVTVGLAFHWFDRARFFAEAGRALDRAGWLAIYNHWFVGRMREHPGFAEWWKGEYLVRYPSPPRGGEPLSAEEARRHGFTLVEAGPFKTEARMALPGLVAYLTTQSNVIAAVEQGREPLAEVTGWLTRSLRPFFPGEAATFAFGGSLWLLRRTSAD